MFSHGADYPIRSFFNVLENFLRYFMFAYQGGPMVSLITAANLPVESMPGDILPPVSMTPGVTLPAVSLTPVVNNYFSIRLPTL
jgi:hypothetical protein